MPLADQTFRRNRRIVEALAGPQQGDRLGRARREFGQRLDVGRGRKRQHRQHHVDVGVVVQCPAHRGEYVGTPDRRGGQVGRVGRPAKARQQRADRRLGRLRILRPFDPHRRAEVGDHDQVAPGDRHCRGPPPAHALAPAQHHCGLVEFAAVVDPHDAELLEGRAADRVGTGDRTGMRRRRPAAGRRTAYLDHDDRLVERGGALGQRAQLAAIGNRLGNREHDPGALVFDHERHVIEQVEIGVVAAADLVADVEAGLLRAPHHVDLPRAARMAGHRDVPGRAARAADHRGRRHRHPVDEVDHAVAVGSHHAHAPLARERRDAGL